MILADQIPVLAIVVGVAILICLVVGALFLFRGYEHLARRSLERKYADLPIHADPKPGDVILTYHTYHGFIAWITQTPHHVALPPEDARKLLGRFLRFNFTWGLVTYGALFIPPLAILNYFAQLRSIAHQEAAGGIPVSVVQSADTANDNVSDSADVPNDEMIESPSLFRRFVGWIAACLCVMFGVSIVVCLATGEFEGAIGGVVITALLGWVARDWLGKRKTNAA